MSETLSEKETLSPAHLRIRASAAWRHLFGRGAPRLVDDEDRIEVQFVADDDQRDRNLSFKVREWWVLFPRVVGLADGLLHGQSLLAERGDGGLGGGADVLVIVC